MVAEKRSLLERLTNHDWFYGYSDDHRVWKRGEAAQKSLSFEVESLGCPYTMNEIRLTVQKMILEEFAEEANGFWYRQPKKYKNVAGVRRSDLIESTRAEEILEWVRLNDQ